MLVIARLTKCSGRCKEKQAQFSVFFSGSFLSALSFYLGSFPSMHEVNRQSCSHHRRYNPAN